MNAETMTEIVELWVECLRRGLTAGLEYTPARNAATDEIREAYPDIQTYFNAAREYRRNGVNTADARTGMVLSAHMGQAAYRLKVELGLRPKRGGGTPPPPAAATNGNGENSRHESIVRTGSGRINVTDTFLALLKCRVLNPGDEVCIGDLELWSAALGVTSTALTMPFRHYDHRPPTAMARAGWRFEIVNPSYRYFTVRVVEAPAPPAPPEPVAPPPPAERTYTAAEVQALFVEFMATRQAR